MYSTVQARDETPPIFYKENWLVKGTTEGIVLQAASNCRWYKTLVQASWKNPLRVLEMSALALPKVIGPYGPRGLMLS